MTELPLLNKFKFPEVLRVQATYRRANSQPITNELQAKLGPGSEPVVVKRMNCKLGKQ
jgi:hypothetical protein